MLISRWYRRHSVYQAERRREGGLFVLAKPFWERVDKDGPLPPLAPWLGPCWVWTSATLKANGYGICRYNKRRELAHRASWFITTGESLTTAEQVCHRCDNPPCVRPSHLFVGSAAVNQRDARLKGRWPHVRERGRQLALDLQCRNGHVRTLENTAYRTSNNRTSPVCRECVNIRVKRWYAKHVHA